MANFKLKLITTWISTPNGEMFAVSSLLGTGDSAMDITGEAAPVDSPVVVEVWCSEETAARIESAGVIILTCEEVQDETIPA